MKSGAPAAQEDTLIQIKQDTKITLIAQRKQGSCFHSFIIRTIAVVSSYFRAQGVHALAGDALIYFSGMCELTLPLSLLSAVRK